MGVHVENDHSVFEIYKKMQPFVALNCQHCTVSILQALSDAIILVENGNCSPDIRTLYYIKL